MPDNYTSYLDVLPAELLFELTQFYLHKKPGEPSLDFTSEHPLGAYIVEVSNRIRLHKFAPEYIQNSYIDWSNDQQRKKQLFAKRIAEVEELQSKMQVLLIEGKALRSTEKKQQQEVQARREFLQQELRRANSSVDSCYGSINNSEFLESQNIYLWIASFFGGEEGFQLLPSVELELDDYLFAEDLESPITKLRIPSLPAVQVIIIKNWDDSLLAIVPEFALPRESDAGWAYVSLNNVKSPLVADLFITNPSQATPLLSWDGVCTKGVEHLVHLIEGAQKSPHA